MTILFSDVAGSTALGEELDPEDLRALLSRYYGIAKEIVAEHGGTLEKFIGDAVMAVFGLPTAHGDDAVRAIAAVATFDDGERKELFSFYPDEIMFDEGELVGLTEREAHQLRHTKDVAYLRAP